MIKRDNPNISDQIVRQRGDEFRSSVRAFGCKSCLPKGSLILSRTAVLMLETNFQEKAEHINASSWSSRHFAFQTGGGIQALREWDL